MFHHANLPITLFECSECGDNAYCVQAVFRVEEAHPSSVVERRYIPESAVLLCGRCEALGLAPQIGETQKLHLYALENKALYDFLSAHEHLIAADDEWLTEPQKFARIIGLWECRLAQRRMANKPMMA